AFSRDRLCVIPSISDFQAFLSSVSSPGLAKLRFVASVIPSIHLNFGRPLRLLPSSIRSIRLFSKESRNLIKWPKYCSCSFSIALSSDECVLV
ncbi:hypothetical protein M514_18151, partial [Trichuris suis]